MCFFFWNFFNEEMMDTSIGLQLKIYIVFIQVGDFGLSKIKRNTLVSGGVRGTLPWMAPELLNGHSSKVSEKVSVCPSSGVL